MARSVSVMKPMRFRFVEPGDVEKYGGDWTIYDESQLLRIPTGQLIEIERTIRMSLAMMINRGRLDFADATLAGMWVARKLAGVDEDYATFEPLILLSEWEAAPTGDDADPPDPASTSSTTSEPSEA